MAGRWGALLLMLAGLACAPRTAMSGWPYSAWYREGDVAGSRGEFHERRTACLDRVGAADDGEPVEPGSAKERDFVACMNGAGWCTLAYGCPD